MTVVGLYYKIWMYVTGDCTHIYYKQYRLVIALNYY